MHRMINNTSCWYCSVVYPKDWPKCPECNHQNANEDLKAALRELFLVIGDETDDDPYCQCGNDPYEEEAASGKCASCGKELP